MRVNNDYYKLQGVCEFLLWLSNIKHTIDDRTGEVLVLVGDVWEPAFERFIMERQKEG